MKGKTKILLKEVKREIGEKARHLENTYKKALVKSEHFDEFLRKIRMMQDRMIQKPRSKNSQRWLRKKLKSLELSPEEIKSANDGELRVYLEKLKFEAERVDNKILAQAAALSKEYHVYFLSWDADHLILKDVMEKSAKDKGGRLEILHPKEIM